VKARPARDKGIMKRIFLALSCLGWLAAGSAPAGSADKLSAEGLASEESLLGAAAEAARFQSLLPFTREIALAGIVAESLGDAMTAAGVPSVVMLNVRHALGVALDLEHEVQPGDRFRICCEQSFTLQGGQVGVGRLLRAELSTRSKGDIGVQRFHAAKHGETLWLTSGQAAAPAAMRLPLDRSFHGSPPAFRADQQRQAGRSACPSGFESSGRGPFFGKIRGDHGAGDAYDPVAARSRRRGIRHGSTNKKQALLLGARHSDGAHLVDHRSHERHVGGDYSASSGALPAMSFLHEGWPWVGGGFP
jgi:hypothetical protein